MTERRTYKQNAIDNIFNTVWGSYAKGVAPFPQEEIHVAGVSATFLFYLGYLEQAKEASYLYSTYMEAEAWKRFSEFDRIYTVFLAALFRDLAGARQEVQELWPRIVDWRQKLSVAQLYKARQSHLLIYEGYALAKLEQYGEVAEPVRLGFEGLRKGRGVHESPHKNSREYGLADVLLTLSDYKLEPGSKAKQAAQEALVIYKQENVKYGRLGYPVIFDLQFSYPDVFITVLPNPDPKKD
ncbi:MAG: hypothetical protein MN733_31805 [Nitrososphaera sp.]|nr:hypothetical protein [Nitrososphaera sp.]